MSATLAPIPKPARVCSFAFVGHTTPSNLLDLIDDVHETGHKYNVRIRSVTDYVVVPDPAHVSDHHHHLVVTHNARIIDIAEFHRLVGIER